MAKAKRFRFGVKAYNHGASAISPPPTLVAQWLRMNPDLFTSNDPIDYRRAARSHNRLMEWAAKKSTGDLVDAIGRLAWERAYYQDAYKFAAENADQFRTRNRKSQELLNQRSQGHSKGGKKRHSISAAGIAKKAAQALWDERMKQRLLGGGKRLAARAPTADELMRALELRGHEVASSTVSKWVTKLRSGKRLIEDNQEISLS